MDGRKKMFCNCFGHGRRGWSRSYDVKFQNNAPPYQPIVWVVPPLPRRRLIRTTGPKSNFVQPKKVLNYESKNQFSKKLAHQMSVCQEQQRGARGGILKNFLDPVETFLLILRKISLHLLHPALITVTEPRSE